MVNNKGKIVESKFLIIACIMAFSLHSCKVTDKLNVQVYETSERGNSLTKITQFSTKELQLLLPLILMKNFKLLQVSEVLSPNLRLIYSID